MFSKTTISNAKSVLALKMEACRRFARWVYMLLIERSNAKISSVLTRKDISQYVHDSVSNVSHLPTVNNRV